MKATEDLKLRTRRYGWVNTLPEKNATEMFELYDEMAKGETIEAKVFKAIDSLEALIQHNISDLSTWIPKEYELNKTYADDKVEFFRIFEKFTGRDTQRYSIDARRSKCNNFTKKVELEQLLRDSTHKRWSLFWF